jgi:hypothetical protein
MTEIFSTVQTLLRDSGYRTRLLPFEQSTVLCFEDESILGFCYIFPSPDMLLASWTAIESQLLSHHTVRFRLAGDKAWNIYSVFLTEGEANSSQTREIRWIEENLDRTRKIAASGISTKENVLQALLPLLRLQYRPIVEMDSFSDRLKNRIATIAPSAANVVLNDDVPAIEVVRILEGQL